MFRPGLGQRLSSQSVGSRPRLAKWVWIAFISARDSASCPIGSPPSAPGRLDRAEELGSAGTDRVAPGRDFERQRADDRHLDGVVGEHARDHTRQASRGTFDPVRADRADHLDWVCEIAQRAARTSPLGVGHARFGHDMDHSPWPLPAQVRGSNRVDLDHRIHEQIAGSPLELGPGQLPFDQEPAAGGIAQGPSCPDSLASRASRSPSRSFWSGAGSIWICQSIDVN